MPFAEFEEKQYEIAFNIELGFAGPVFPSGQVLEELTGYDAVADPSANHVLWRILSVPRPPGVRLLPTHWTPSERRSQPPATRLPMHPVSFIAQFKRPEYLQGSGAAQYRFWKQPYYRFRRTKQQHAQLRRLEGRLVGVAKVVYASPAFHRYADLERAQLRGNVVDLTGFVSPIRMGRHAVWTYTSPGLFGRGNPDGEELRFATFEALFAGARRVSGQELANRESLREHLGTLAAASRAVAASRGRAVDSWISEVEQMADVSPEILDGVRDFATIQSLAIAMGASWWLLDGDELTPTWP